MADFFEVGIEIWTGDSGAFEFVVEVGERVVEVVHYVVPVQIFGYVGKGCLKGKHDVEQFAPDGETAETFDNEDNAHVEGEV